MIISRLPSGGGGKPGIKDGKGLVNLNIFTQQDEPKVKDGIWIKTNSKYQQVMVNQPTVTNFAEGVFSQLSSSLPYESNALSFFEYNNILYAKYMSRNYVYRYNGLSDSWTKIQLPSLGSSYPTSCPDPMFVYNGSIYGLAYYSPTSNHRLIKYDNSLTSFTDTNVSVGNQYTPYLTTVYNNKLWIFGVGTNNHNTWIYDGQSVTALGQSFEQMATCLVYKGYIHCMGMYSSSGNKNHSRISIQSNGSVLVQTLQPLPTDMRYTSAAVFNNELLFFSDRGYLYRCNDNDQTWTSIAQNPHFGYVTNNVATMYNGYPHLFEVWESNREHYTWRVPSSVYTKNTFIIRKGSTNNGTYLTNIVDTASVISGDGSNNRFVSGFDDCFYFADVGFDWTAPMYYGDGTKWIKFKN